MITSDSRPPPREIDAARLPVMLTMLRLPTIGRLWEAFAAQADKEGWGAARFLAALCEHEIADRDRRRIARHLHQSGLPVGKTFATFDFAAVPTIRKAHVLALAESDAWLDQGANILCFGPSDPASWCPSRYHPIESEHFAADRQTADGAGDEHRRFA